MSKMSALIVDDSVGVRRELVSLIAGYSQFGTLVIAGSSHEALEIVETLNPDLIIYDIPFGGSSDPQTIRQLRKSVPDAGIIAISLYDEYRIHAVEAGADEFVAKTAPMSALTKAVDRLCPSKATVR